MFHTGTTPQPSAPGTATPSHAPATAPMVLPRHILRQNTSHTTSATTPPITPTDQNWHAVLGHPDDQWTQDFCRHHRIPLQSSTPHCTSCDPASLLRTPSWTLPPPFATHNTGPFRIIRCDLLRLFPEHTFPTRNYVLVIQDVFSGYVALRFLHAPTDAGNALRSFIQFHYAQRRHLPALLFTSTPVLFRPHLDRRTRIYHAPKMQTHTIRARINLVHRDTGLALQDWPYTCKYLFYLANRSPFRGKTPLDIWTGQRHTLPRLRPFGCNAVFQRHSQPVRRGTFLGYTPSGQYLVRDCYTREVHTLRGAVFEHLKMPDPPPGLQVSTATATRDLPMSYKTASTAPDAQEWTTAMNEELSTLAELNVWTLVPPPTNARVIPTKWVFTKKFHPDGTLRKHKARLVVSGNRQTQGEDYVSSFSPVVKHSSVRLLLALAAKRDYHVSFIDVTNAYGWGTLSEETYCKQPPGFEQTTPQGEPLVCRLHKSLYGLPQSGRCWNQRLTEILIQVGLRQSDFDPCVFYKITTSTFFSMCAYVDDNMVVSSTNALTTFFLNKIKQLIKIVPVTNQLYLGMNIAPTSDGFRLDQSSYVEKILTRFGMGDCKPVRTPLVVSQSGEQSLHEQKTPLLISSKPYQELLGCLLFLSNVSRPDLAFPTVAMSVHGHAPMQHHFGILKRILRYLKGTPDFAIHFTKTTIGHLYAASDASHANFPNSKSVSGIAIFVGSVPIHWRTKQQSLVALSSCEAETYAIAETCRELVPIRGLLLELAPSLVPSPTVIYTDSYSAMYLILNGGSTRTRHFHKRVNFIQDYLKEYDLALKYMPTNTIPADFLTKPTTSTVCQTTLAQFYNITP